MSVALGLSSPAAEAAEQPILVVPTKLRIQEAASDLRYATKLKASVLMNVF
jgi:hypothetical protein